MNWLIVVLFVGIVWPGSLFRQVPFVHGFPTDSCQFHASNSTLICANFTSTTSTPTYVNASSIRALFLYNVIMTTPLKNFSVFGDLRKLVIQNSNIGNVTNLEASPTLEDIDISNNPRLESINLTNVANMVSVNLSHNSLRYFDGSDLVNLSSLVRLDLTGNKLMCKKDYSWAVELNKAGVLANWRNFNCTEYEGGDEWNQHLYRILHYYEVNRIVQQQCKERVPGCNCTFYDLEPVETKVLYNISVSCANLQLKELPQQLPDRTFRLDLSNNSISNLNRVVEYRHLHQLVLDNNNITSAAELVGTSFVKQFSLLSLKSNPIPPEKIPLEHLELKGNQLNSSDWATDRSGLRLILLENNSWVCNDYLAEVVQKWLWQNRQLLQQDLTRTSTQPLLKIYCSDEYGKPINVFFLFPSAPKEWDVVHFWHWVIGLEVSLIVFVLTKLAFDAYIFKTHNRLPWLATKLFK